MSNEIKQRVKIGELDILRGLGFLAVVLQHAVGVYIRRPEITVGKTVALGIAFNMAKFTVPIFVFITGMVLLYNYYENLRYFSFLRKRTVHIFIPYIIWTLIYNVYYHGIPFPQITWLKSISKDLLLGTGAYHLWYVIMVFQFYIFYPVLLALLKKMRSGYVSSLLIFLGFGTAYLILMWFSARYIPSGRFNPDSTFIQTAFVKYRDRNMLYWLYYFVLGGMAGTVLYKWRDFTLHYFKWNLLFFVLFFSWVNYELFKPGIVNLNISTSLKPSMFLYTLTSILFLYRLAVIISQKYPVVFQVLSFIGQYSFGAYLVHALVLNYVARFLTLMQISEHLFATLTAFLLCAGISVIFTKFLSLFPYSKFVTGYRSDSLPQRTAK